MTLIELLVSVAILSIMILMFSSILSDSQKVVAVSQGTMHANSKAAAIAEIIRNDIKRITQNGFLCITEDANQRPRLLFTTAGVSPSALGADVGSGMIVCYGIANNLGTDLANTDPTDEALWRQGWILRSGGTGADVYGFDLADIQIMDREQCRLEVVNLIVGFAPNDTMPGASRAIVIPLQTPADLRGGWQCLTTACSQLSIMWTDGTLDGSGNLNWFGKANPLNPNWDDGTFGFDQYNPRQREYESAAGGYQILWTHHVESVCPPHDPIVTPCPRHDPTVWPRAIRIRFVLTDDSVPEELGDTELGETVYEVICPIGM